MTAPASDLEITVALRRLVVGVGLIVAATVLGLFIAIEVDPLDVDTWWNGFVSVFAFLQPASLALNVLGGGWVATFVIPLGGALLLLLARRRWAAVFFLAASAASALVVQVLKALFGRARPEDMIVISDHGSYPSGHTANAATIAIVAVIVFPRVWVAVVGGAWIFVMAFSRTQVHAHWFSDTLGGTLVGAGAALVIAAAFTVLLEREKDRFASLG